MRHQERRAGGPRFEASWDVLVGSGNALFPIGRTTNVSRLGMRVVSRVPARAREGFELTVRLPGHRLSRLDGTAVWTTHDQGVLSVGIVLRNPDVEWLSILNELEGASRRRPPETEEPRLRATPRVMTKLHATYGVDTADEYAGSVAELSKAGLMLYGCEPMAEDTELQVAIVTDDTHVELAGCIVWGTPEETPQGYRMGVRLQKPSQSYLELVSRLSPALAEPAPSAEDEGRARASLREMQSVLFRLRASDFYGAFGLRPGDSMEVMEKAFLQTMRRFHPARLPPTADARMRETAQELLLRANEARDILRDPTRRAALLNRPRV